MTRTEGVLIAALGAMIVGGGALLWHFGQRAARPTRRPPIAETDRVPSEPVQPLRGSPAAAVTTEAPAGCADPFAPACAEKGARLLRPEGTRRVGDVVADPELRAPPPVPPEAARFRERALAVRAGETLAEISATMGRPPERTERIGALERSRWTARDGALFFATIDVASGRAVDVQLADE